MSYVKVGAKTSVSRTSKSRISPGDSGQRPNKPKKDPALEAFGLKKKRQARNMVYALVALLLLIMGSVALQPHLSKLF